MSPHKDLLVRIVLAFSTVLLSGSTAKGDIPRLPEAVASFGAAVHDGWLFVYSGHIGGAHEHSRENLCNHFWCLQLEGGREWEELAMQQPLQGFPLVTYGDSLFRVGGMFAKNQADEEDDLYSVADFARFDPKKNRWFVLPALPKARSSHDAVVMDDKLYVAGGWKLDGEGEGKWHTEALVFDLTDPVGSWEKLPTQPFARRALATSHWQGRLAVIGGLDRNGKVSRRFDLYDPVSKDWSQGPELPGKRMGGFGISAWNLNEKLYVSGLDGVVFQLAEEGKSWQAVGKLVTGRFFHRLLPAGPGKLLVVGGSSFESGHLDDVELIELKAPEAKVD